MKLSILSAQELEELAPPYIEYNRVDRPLDDVTNRTWYLLDANRVALNIDKGRIISIPPASFINFQNENHFCFVDKRDLYPYVLLNCYRYGCLYEITLPDGENPTYHPTLYKDTYYTNSATSKQLCTNVLVAPRIIINRRVYIDDILPECKYNERIGGFFRHVEKPF